MAGKLSYKSVRTPLVVVCGEFAGTFLFLFLAFIGAQSAIDTNNFDDLKAPLGPASLMYIASAFGASLTINVWIFYRVSGGMFNPAVSRQYPSPVHLEFTFSS